MTKRFNIMSIWKEFNPLAEKSMKDDFKKQPSPFYNKISLQPLWPQASNYTYSANGIPI